ncbi:hypothetical protein GOARA_043_00760 [Gordonia araii NBRC 100433]|uniref:Uncharacterized protein n=1 Tax=Gordonia araii NBRC 100433 TaxID=1073574 RepID=G7H140_9ACTN|nr:hypothetical protein [Gordonia araii]NNG96713.1 hypothetical protein [Gordonia araii NBRC 100433]GAB09601.1 hypothetical protein GOARA_043_00760 [Gordonia araii NBRC 100433]
MGDRELTLASASDAADVAAFTARLLRLDEAAVVRLQQRDDGLVGLWGTTGFEVLATRAVFGSLTPGDVVCDARTLGGAAGSGALSIDPGFALDSAWRGALPPQSGYRQVDDVPLRTIVDLAQRGAALAKEPIGGHGPATSLLDQVVLEVADHSGDTSVGVALRSLFALTGMGFARDRNGRAISESSTLDDIDDDEPVRVRASGTWIRLDARFGAVYQRRGDQFAVTVL